MPRRDQLQGKLGPNSSPAMSITTPTFPPEPDLPPPIPTFPFDPHLTSRHCNPLWLRPRVSAPNLHETNLHQCRLVSCLGA